MAPVAFATTVTWDGGGGDSDWFNSNNWTTALNATNVTIQNGGGLQHVLCNTNALWSNTNHVYVVCSNLTVETGGSINVNNKGYPGGAVGTDGYGPGAGISSHVNYGYRSKGTAFDV